MKFEHPKIESILSWFEQISQIPRCSKHEEAVGRWLIEWATQNEFGVKKDAVGNLLIQVPASSGYETAPIVVLQGHLDMVCEKTPGSEHNFMTDPIKLIYDGDWIRADRTTLGADDGLGVAFMLALATDQDCVHPPLELLFTVQEEIGLVGANRLASDFMTGRTLINLDSETEGHFTIGCAGGTDAVFSLALNWDAVPADHRLVKIKVGGLKGGHSGMDINKGRANAIKMVAQVLLQLREDFPHFQLVDLQGGSARNAIPRDAEALVAFAAVEIDEVKKSVAAFAQFFQAAYQKTEPTLSISCEVSDETPKQAISLAKTSLIIDALMVLPHGVLGMSGEIADLVETSSNLAQVGIKEGELVIATSQRSSKPAMLTELSQQMSAMGRLLGGTIQQGNHYPAWQPQLDSPLLAKTQEVYRRLFNQSPVIKAIHAGLECGIIGEKFPGLDMISVGFDVEGLHSPNERLRISSLGKNWDFLTALLADCVC
jgi:dipeptidase D